MHATEGKGNEYIKTKDNNFAFKLLIFEDSFAILSIFKSQSLEKESGFILNKVICLNWNTLLLKNKTKPNPEKIEKYVRTLFWSCKRPTYSQIPFTRSRAGDEKAQWKLLELARKHPAQEKANICVCLFLSSPCTLYWEPPKEQRDLCFEETVLRHLNRSRWDTLLLFHNPEGGKKSAFSKRLCY